MGDLDLIPGLGRSPGEGKGYPLQYSGLENSTDCRVRGVAKSPTRLSEFHSHFAFLTGSPFLLPRITSPDSYRRMGSVSGSAFPEKAQLGQCALWIHLSSSLDPLRESTAARRRLTGSQGQLGRGCCGGCSMAPWSGLRPGPPTWLPSP